MALSFSFYLCCQKVTTASNLTRWPSQVQGQGWHTEFLETPKSICPCSQALTGQPTADLITVARGGGYADLARASQWGRVDTNRNAIPCSQEAGNSPGVSSADLDPGAWWGMGAELGEGVGTHTSGLAHPEFTPPASASVCRASPLRGLFSLSILQCLLGTFRTQPCFLTMC